MKIGFNSDWSPFSSENDTQVGGILVRLTEQLISTSSGTETTSIGLPWARVQREVESGRLDAMVTFASKERLTYAYASEQSLYEMETKAFVRKGSAAAAALRADPSFETHRRFKHCVILGNGWSTRLHKNNNLPYEDGINSAGCLRQLAAGRQDVFIVTADVAHHLVDKLGLGNRIVDLPKVYASVPLKFLLSKKSEFSRGIIDRLDAEIRTARESGQYRMYLQLARAPIVNASTATLEWPPYTSASLPDGGHVTKTVRNAFGAVGIDTKVAVIPWKRAIAYAKSNTNDVIAYFPGYHCRHDTGFVKSSPIGRSHLSIAERKDTDVTWSSLDELARYRIGTVVGYANTDQFDARVANGTLKTISSFNDAENLKKLAEGKIDAAVVDRNVFHHLIVTDPALRELNSIARIDDRPLAERSLHMCFRDDPRGRAAMSRFNDGLKATITPGVGDAKPKTGSN